MEILRDLETTAYYLDENFSGDILARHTIHAILRWANMLNRSRKVGAPYVLWFIFLTQSPRVWLSLLTTSI